MSLGISERRRLEEAWSRPGRITTLRPKSTVAGLGVLALAAGAALRGQLLAASPHAEDASPWLVAAAVLGLVGLELIGEDHPRHVGRPAPLADSRPRAARLGAAELMALGSLMALLAAALVLPSPAHPAATWVWLLGLASIAAGAALADRGQPRPSRRLQRLPLLELAFLALVLGVALWLRLPNLTSIPPDVHGDEAAIGLDARRILAGQMPPVFATGWYDVPALSFAIPAASMAIFGDNLFGLRLASVIQGVLSVALLYLLARRLWGPRPALLAAALMAIAAWHIHFSRTGFHYMQAPVATLLVLLFLMRGLDSRRLLDFVLCGFALGLCFEVYWAARLAPILVGLCLAYRFLVDRQPWRRYLPGLAALALGTLAFLAPMAVVYARSPGSFGSRALGVLVTSPANLQHELDGYHVDTLSEVLAIQTQRTLESFNIRGETSLQYGHPGPLLDPWTGGLLAIGALATLRLGSMRRVLLASWIWLTLLFGSVLTVDALFSPHVLVALPALALAAALVLESAWRGLTRLAGLAGTYAFALPVLAVLGLALQANVHDYFDVQTVERQPAGRFTLLASYVQTLDERYRLYVIGRDDWTFNFETTRFLVPNPDAVDVRNEPLALPLDRIPSSKGVAFLVENAAPDYAQRLDAIRQAYPTGHAEVIAGGAPVFTSYLVENPDLARANPGAARD